MELGFEYIGQPGPNVYSSHSTLPFFSHNAHQIPDNSNHGIINDQNISNSSQDISWKRHRFADILLRLHFPPLNIQEFVIDYSKGHWKSNPMKLAAASSIGLYLDSHYSTHLSSMKKPPRSPREAEAPTKATWHCHLVNMYDSRAGTLCPQLISGQILTFPYFLFSLCSDCITKLFLYFI